MMSNTVNEGSSFHGRSLDFETVAKWSTQEVGSWLRLKGHSEEHIQLLCTQQRIDGKSLLLLTETDLRQPPIQILVRLLFLKCQNSQLFYVLFLILISLYLFARFWVTLNVYILTSWSSSNCVHWLIIQDTAAEDVYHRFCSSQQQSPRRPPTTNQKVSGKAHLPSTSTTTVVIIINNEGLVERNVECHLWNLHPLSSPMSMKKKIPSHPLQLITRNRKSQPAIRQTIQCISTLIKEDQADMLWHWNPK